MLKISGGDSPIVLQRHEQIKQLGEFQEDECYFGRGFIAYNYNAVIWHRFSMYPLLSFAHSDSITLQVLAYTGKRC